MEHLFTLLALYRRLFPRRITGRRAGGSLVLDGCIIRDAKFRNCELIYGGGPLTMVNVETRGCEWTVYGAAANTIALVKMIAESDPDYVRKTFGLLEG